MRELTIDDFARHRGKQLPVNGPDGAVELKLVHVQELPGSSRAGGAFRLEFHGPLQPFLPQAIYGFDLGGERADIFIVPLGPVGEGMRYEAIFF
jgi:uncharacterized protein DUF6916